MADEKLIAELRLISRGEEEFTPDFYQTAIRRAADELAGTFGGNVSDAARIAKLRHYLSSCEEFGDEIDSEDVLDILGGIF